MSIKIHWGPPGSYKTSGAIGSDLPAAVKAGRVLVTNVRGLCDREKIDDALGGDVGIPESFKIIYLPTSDCDEAAANLAYLARFFHWAPYGAFFILDEAQFIFPKSWAERDIRALDYPGGAEKAALDRRPADFRVAWDMHRHYGWDIILTTPNIRKIRDDIRQASEGGFKHKNLGLLGIGGRYIEGFHLADDSGSSASDMISVQVRKVPKWVWGCYASTATGTISDTMAGQPLYKNPRLVFGAFLLVCFGWYLLSKPMPKMFGGKGTVVASENAAAVVAGAADVARPVSPLPPAPDPVGTVSGAASAGSVGAVPGAVRPPDSLGRRSALLTRGLENAALRIAGSVVQVGGEGYRLFAAQYPDGSTVYFRTRELLAMGYKVSALGPCSVVLEGGQENRLVTCGRFEQVAKVEPNPPP